MEWCLIQDIVRQLVVCWHWIVRWFPGAHHLFPIVYCALEVANMGWHIC